MSNTLREIKVSVCVSTYNQEKYILQCLESLVDQKTDFNFEIIVGEDCSTDSTRKIVSDFSDKYPNLIVKNFHSENIGAVKNIISTYKLAKGKYICHMDGDDYALPDKLQKQFDALESNPSCIICSHDTQLTNSYSAKLKEKPKSPRKNINTLTDLYETLPFFAHSSKMFLNDLSSSYWHNFKPETTDIEIHVKQAKKGDIFHINENLGVYREGVGMSVQNSNKVNSLLPSATRRIFEEAMKEGIVDSKVLKKYYAKSLFNYAYQSALMGDKQGLVNYIKESISQCVFSKEQLVFSKLSTAPTLVISICKLRYYLQRK